MKISKSFYLIALLLLLGTPGLSWASAVSTTADADKSAQELYIKALLLEKSGDYAGALSAYDSALTFDPHSSYICRQAADLALETGMLDKALTFVNRAISTNPQSAESRLLLGQVQWAQGNLKAAQASLEEALKLDPKSMDATFSLSNLLAANSPKEALKLLRQYLDNNPDNAAQTRYEISKIDLQTGNLAETEKDLDSAFSLDPDLDVLSVRYALAQAYEAKNSTDAALGEYRKILDYEPQNVLLLDRIGELELTEGDWDKAKESFEFAKTLTPGDPDANHWLAVNAERNGDFAGAVAYLKSSSALSQDPSLSLQLSYDLTQSDQLKSAISVLELAYRRWPKNDEISYFLALGYQDMKEDVKAIRLLRQALALKPDFHDARYQLAVILEQDNNIKEAEKEFRLLLAQNPDDASVLNYLGYSLADRGLELPQAENLIAKAVSLDPGNGAYADSLGWVYFKEGRSTEAVHAIQKAIALIPDDETVWDHLGDAYAGAGSLAQAWKAWMRSQSLTNPKDRNMKKALSAEKGFSPEDLGAYYLSYLNLSQGGIKKLSGLCQVEGSVLGRPLSFKGLFVFHAPHDVNLDWLGPWFTPLLRMRLSRDSFVMDPVAMPGLDPAAVMDAAGASLSAIRDYLSGSIDSLRPALYSKGWTGSGISVPGWQISLSSDGLSLVSLQPQPAGTITMSLADFSNVQGRQIPRSIRISGKGFVFNILFGDFHVDLVPLAEASSHL